jgi:hypothetical protein
MGELENAVEEGATLVESALADGIDRIEALGTNWRASLVERRKEIERRLADAGIRDPGELGKWQRRMAELNAQLAAVPAAKTTVENLERERGEYLNRLGAVRRRKSRLLADAVASFEETLRPRVRMRLTPFGDRSPLRAALEAAVRRQGVQQAQLHALATHEPQEIAAAMADGT